MFLARNCPGEFRFHFRISICIVLFSKVKTKFSWSNTLEFQAENVPQKSEKKVEESKDPSEFQSDA